MFVSVLPLLSSDAFVCRRLGRTADEFNSHKLEPVYRVKRRRIRVPEHRLGPVVKLLSFEPRVEILLVSEGNFVSLLFTWNAFLSVVIGTLIILIIT